MNKLKSKHFETFNDVYTDYIEKIFVISRCWKCCIEILQMLVEDKVYKVYLAALRTLRALLNFSQEPALPQLKLALRPVLHSVLLKCADGNRRVSEISRDTLVELARGRDGDLAVGKYTSPAAFNGLDYLLQLVLEERELASVTWQWIMGRLVILDRLLAAFPAEFSLEAPRGCQANFNRLMMVIDFSFQNLTSAHANVGKLAKQVFTVSARNTAADTTTFNQVNCIIINDMFPKII